MANIISEIDLTGDGGIVKQILKEGEGITPPNGAKVKAHYVGTLVENGQKFDSSRDRGQVFSFPLGKGNVIKGWDIGIATMKKGEIANLICQYDYAYGAAGSPPTIPPKANLKFEVELIDWDEPEPETTLERVKAANKAKEDGNGHFNAGRYAEAASKYETALQYFEKCWGLTPGETKEVDSVKLPCLLNLAASQIKTTQFREAILNCSKALDIDNKNVKALYRRGQALWQNGDFEEAKKDLTEAIHLAPKNKELRQELEKAKTAETNYKVKQKQMFAGLFDKMSKKDQEKESKSEN